jgi:tetratricopeptide (TPR) repeat protein
VNLITAMAKRAEEQHPPPEHRAHELEGWVDESVAVSPEASWSRRHRAIVIAATAMACAGVVALAVGFITFNVQDRVSARHRVRVEADLRKAGDAVERLLTRVAEDRVKEIPLEESLRAEFLEDASKFERASQTEDTDDPDVRLKAARLARLTADLRLRLDRPDQAEGSCRHALEIVDGLLARASRDLRCRREYASTLDVLGCILATLDRVEEAEYAYRKAIEIRGPVLMEEPASSDDRWRMAVCFDRIGVLLHGSGRWEEAEHFLIRGRKVCEVLPSATTDDPRVRRELAAILGHLGQVLTDRGRRAEAMENYAHAVRVQRALLTAVAHSWQDRICLIEVLGDQADAMAADGHPAAAERIRMEIRELITTLSTDDAAMPRYQRLAATNFGRLAGEIARDSSRIGEVRALYVQAITIEEGLVAMAPTVREYRANLVQTCDRLAGFLRTRRALDDAEAVYRKALSHQSRLVAEHPGHVEYRFGHGQVLHNLADLLREGGHPREGLPLQQEAVRQLGALYHSDMKDPLFRRAYSYALWTLASILVDLKDHRAAVRAVTDYLEIDPNGFEESFEAVGFLCRCVALGREDPGIAAEEREALAHTYADRAIDAMRSAIRNGFRDADLLMRAVTYEPLRAGDEFGQLVQEVMALSGHESINSR